MRLKKWLKEKGLTYEMFKEDIGVSVVTITSWCNGNKIPQLRHMKDIYRITKGEVEPKDFYHEFYEEE